MFSKYLKLFLAIVNNNLVAVLEYRVRFLLSLITAIFWFVFQLVVIEIFFQYTNNLFGWNRAELFLFTGFFRVIKSVFDIFVSANLFEFSEEINQGMFDFVLARPVNSLFLISIRRHKYEDIPGVIIGIVIIFYSLIILNFPINIMTIVEIIGVILTGFLAYYSLFLFISTLAIFMTRVSAISEINNVFANALRYPTTVVSRNNLLADILILPMAVTLTYPIMIFLRRGNAFIFVLEMVILGLLVFGVLRFWRFALKYYSSASS